MFVYKFYIQNYGADFVEFRIPRVHATGCCTNLILIQVDTIKLVLYVKLRRNFMEIISERLNKINLYTA
jgi:hypothetical protein